MYRDNSLIPSEAIRLAALGTLALTPGGYADLAAAVRHFASRIVGPSIELIGPPIELLKVEGLVEADNAGVMRITEAGRAELERLLTARLRGSLGELNKLAIALKLRFLHLLDREQQLLQAELLTESCAQERIRLADLRRHHAAEGGHLVDWLDHELAEFDSRLAWLRALQQRL